MGRKYDDKHLSLNRRRVSFKKGWMKRLVILSYIHICYKKDEQKKERMNE